MIAIFYLALQILKLYSYVVIANVVISWLVAFNVLNTSKTLETMRNTLNTYLGDVDAVVEEITEQRPEYENNSEGFLKIRRLNQSILIKNNQHFADNSDQAKMDLPTSNMSLWINHVQEISGDASSESASDVVFPATPDPPQPP